MMEVSLPVDFSFTPPYLSAPSSPPRRFYSAPTSPAVPFFWEHKPGVVKQPSSLASSCYHHEIGLKKDFDYDFDFGVKFAGVISPSADELFDGGRIKPLKPPPGFDQYKPGQPELRSPVSPKKMIVEALSPRRNKKDLDPFAAAMVHVQESADLQRRGRSRSRHKGTRSLSPFRVRDMLLDQEEATNNYSGDVPGPSAPSSWLSSRYQRWKIKSSFFKKSRHQDEVCKESSLSWSSTSTGGSDSLMGGRPPIAAHQLLYSASRSFAHEMEMRKGLLPRKLNLLGCLGFFPSNR